MKNKFRPAVFAVAYKKEKSKILYLLLKRKLHWTGWEFPKGGIEKGETELQAVKREIKEETNLEAIKIINHKVKGKYLYDNKTKEERQFIGQTYSLYSVEVKPGKIKFDKKEHSGYKWLSFEKAIKKLTWKTQKVCFKKVNNKLR